MNTRAEFIKHIGSRKVLCAQISYDDYDGPLNLKFFNLTTGWTEEDWKVFLDSLDFDYDSGYGIQNLFGTIWYSDGTWSERGEYDGSEWWSHHSCPQIPEELHRKDKVRDEKLNQLL
jgi:hypothetical protein